MKKPKRGAPAGNQNAAKKHTADTVIAARVDVARRRRYERAASDGGISLSGWVVRSCDAALDANPDQTARAAVDESIRRHLNGLRRDAVARIAAGKWDDNTLFGVVDAADATLLSEIITAQKNAETAAKEIIYALTVRGR